MKQVKTNAMRILDQAHAAYQIHTYESDPEHIDGISVATKLNQNPEQVFKTLITLGNNHNYYVFVVPVSSELDLKKCAAVVGVKSVEMIHVKDINKVSGYIRGGCSPIGMKKNYQTIFDETCLLYDSIIFSGGKIGCQIEMSPQIIIKLLDANTADISK